MRFLLFVFFLISFVDKHGQITKLNENFDSGIPTGWDFRDGDKASPFIDTINSNLDSAFHLVVDFDSTDLADSVFAASSWFEDAFIPTTASNFLISPKIKFDSTGNLVTFQALSVDGSYPDGLQLFYTFDKNIDSLMIFPPLLEVPAVPSLSTDYKVYLDAIPLDTSFYLVFRHYADNQFILSIDNIAVVSDDISSVSDTKKSKLKIYPNPSNGKFTIAGKKTSSNAIIFNSLGIIVWQGEVKNSSLEFNFNKGYYILNCDGENHPFIIK